MDNHEKAFTEWWMENGIELRNLARKAFFAGAEHGIDEAVQLLKSNVEEEANETK